jgi:hypothetical protein
MKTPLSKRWLLVVAYAVAMAWLEAATVYDLRVMADRVNPYQPNPLPMSAVVERVELVREAATLVMLLTVGALAGRTWRARIAYAAIAFGVWDIFYYAFLRWICGWPTSLFDWDILFLLPLPWWGPVLAPACIAMLMIVWGTLESEWSREARETFTSTRSLSWLGIALALYVFMADSLRAVHQGIAATRFVLPTSFNWSLFALALALMAAPVAQTAWRIARVTLPSPARRS